MINLTDKKRMEVLGEALVDELKVIHEYLADIPIIKKELEDIKAHMAKQDQRLDGHGYDIHQLKQQLA